MPPNIAPNQNNIQPRTPKKPLLLIGGGILFVLVVGVVAFFVLQMQKDQDVVSQDEQVIEMAPDLTSEQIKQRDEAMAKLDALAKEVNATSTPTEAEMSAKLDELAKGVPATSTPTEAEMSARLDELGKQVQVDPTQEGMPI
jgi:hypothetical protein